MQNEEGPPVYSEYPIELPNDFPIGRQKTQPLVNLTELQAHLRLLGAFHKLKEDVQAQEDGIAARNKDQAWVVFVNRAAHRFYTWASSTWPTSVPGLNETMMPPLDIIMVWHSYLLNPRAYYEDSVRMGTTYSANLRAIQEMPLSLVSSLIDSQSLEALPPSSERQRFFEETTYLTFSVPLITEMSDTMTLDCPICKQKNHLVKWIAMDDKGFAQTKFEHRCESCNMVFTKSNIGVRRFADEVTLRRTGRKVYISETLLDPRTGTMNTKEADAFTKRVFQYLDDRFHIDTPIPPEDVETMAKQLASGLQYKYETLSTHLHMSLQPDPNHITGSKPYPRIQRVCVAYSHAGLSSLDLVGAILRQGAFITKMFELGWTLPGRFDHAKDLAPLTRSVARYHAFLDVMTVHSTTFLVPTLDIDLAWHSHQLKGAAYRNDTMKYLGRTPNHDDNVDAFALSKGYDITAKVWRSRFGVPYSLCGCIPDPDAGSLLSRFASKIGTIGKKGKERASVPPLINKRPDLTCPEDEAADSSHPSEHNLHFGNPQDAETWAKKDAQQKKATKCATKAKKSASRDAWRALQVERNGKKEDGSHKDAFTDPYYGYGYYYPYWGVSMAVPFGFYGGYAYSGMAGACGAGCGTSPGPSCAGGDGGGGCGVSAQIGPTTR